MNKIIVGAVEIEVLKVSAFTYDYGKGEKVLRIEVDDAVASFADLQAALEGATLPIQYFEGDTLKCEYVGYNKFESQYKDGIHKVEMHKATVDEQMSALLVANEKLTEAQAALEKANEQANKTIEMLEEQNTMLEACILEISEIIYA